ncbi:MAG: HEAT repeat domain-containing protein [Anaerolineae bacterium]|nr:HEAT repeat domain-containing protein [Anaerolineae bacterium]
MPPRDNAPRLGKQHRATGAPGLKREWRALRRHIEQLVETGDTAALDALGERAVPELVRIAADRQEPDFNRIYAAIALAEIGSLRAVAPLTRILLAEVGHPGSENVVYEVGAALAQIGTPEALTAVRHAGLPF